MAKPTFHSVTEQPCACRYLENEANDPDSPIIFHASTGEYQFSFGDAMLILYHCPFCGGAAPKSRRHLLFAVISNDERERFADLMREIRTLDEAFEKLGPPDYEMETSSQQVEQDGQPPRVEYHRQLCYERLSEVAELRVEEWPGGKISWFLRGKPLS